MGETDNRGGGIPIMSIHRRIHQEGRSFGWNTSVGWRLGEILMVDLYLQFLEWWLYSGKSECSRRTFVLRSFKTHYGVFVDWSIEWSSKFAARGGCFVIFIFVRLMRGARVSNGLVKCLYCYFRWSSRILVLVFIFGLWRRFCKFIFVDDGVLC